MKKLTLKILLIVGLAFPSPGLAVESDDILGEWVTEGGDARVEIFKKENRYFGKIAAIIVPNYLPGEKTGMDGKPRLDSNNQDKSLRSRTMVGIELMKDFRFEDGMWIDGQIYNPENGKNYKCEISLTEDGKLQVRGYIGVSLFGSTTVWESKKSYLERELVFLGLNNCSCQ